MANMLIEAVSIAIIIMAIGGSCALTNCDSDYQTCVVHHPPAACEVSDGE